MTKYIAKSRNEIAKAIVLLYTADADQDEISSILINGSTTEYVFAQFRNLITPLLQTMWVEDIADHIMKVENEFWSADFRKLNETSADQCANLVASELFRLNQAKLA